ncbi:ADP-ribosylation factor-like [Lytechinus variegatus]|uniref:ADP-ribosylation factor-like n=1 Tax=Lytechinus variegatus TaxID=7654 RepID=UPI001BB1F018|nr:ADP-ribosylation factor-like [Lytechinus variegatus]
MGNVVNKFTSAFGDWSKNPTRVLMLGLDAAGKTTILYKLKCNETVQTIPTIGFNVETITPVPGLTLTVWDVGGQERLRALWRHYYVGTEGIIFVIDSADQMRFLDAREELFNMLNSDDILDGTPLLILCNKQDMSEAESVSRISETLDLKRITKNPWHIQAISALSGEGLLEGMTKIAKMVKNFKKENMKKEHASSS